jgi:release factor glutamine methyltransferase
MGSHQRSDVSYQRPAAAGLLRDAVRKIEGHGIDDAQLEAEVMLAEAMRIDRAHLLARLRDDVPADARDGFATMVTRRLRREPLAYILGRREFYGIEIACAPGALIPRPETELLVDLALDEIARRGGAARVADVGTGSGAIAVAIALNASGAHVTAIDASPDALAVARRSIARSELGARVELVEGDLFADAGVFDVIVANLPYVAEDEWWGLAPEIRGHEPREALVAGRAGTESIERLLATAEAHLAPGGLLAAEIGCKQGPRLLDAVSRLMPDAESSVMGDLAAHDRVLVVRQQGG